MSAHRSPAAAAKAQANVESAIALKHRSVPVPGQCEAAKGYAHDFLHCPECISKGVRGRTCTFSQCPCNGAGIVFDTSSPDISVHQLPQDNKSVKLKNDRPKDIRDKVGKLLKSMEFRMAFPTAKKSTPTQVPSSDALGSLPDLTFDLAEVPLIDDVLGAGSLPASAVQTTHFDPLSAEHSTLDDFYWDNLSSCLGLRNEPQDVVFRETSDPAL